MRGRHSANGGAQGRVLVALRVLGRPVTLRELCATVGLSETGASKILHAALGDGLVTRTQGPPPAVGSVRPWLWEVAT